MRFFRLHPQNDVNYHVENILESFKCKVLNDLTSYRLNVFKKTAFTLAEVLITLGIIGVVAAITMPTIIKNHYKRVIEIKLEKTHAELQDIIRKSELENGSFKYWDYDISSDAFARKYILPYLAEPFTPCPHRCFKGNYASCAYKTPTGENLGVFPYGAVYFINKNEKHNDKIMLVATGTANCDMNFPGVCTAIRYASFIIDIDGNKVGPSVMGKDVFQFTLFNYTKQTGWGNNGSNGAYYGLYPGHVGAGYYGSYKVIDSEVRTRCGGAPLYLLGDCTILLQRNNWKFPKDYPIKF